MTDPNVTLRQLKKNLNILRERKAKYGRNVPLALLNQIKDHEQAIALTERAITGELSETVWWQTLKPLLGNIRERMSEDTSLTIGDVGNDIVNSINAGQDDQITGVQHQTDFDQRGQQVGTQVNVGRDAYLSFNLSDIRWLPAVIILVLILGLMAYLYLQLRPQPPSRMSGQFNVAVAEFLIQDEEGNPIRSDDGIALANYLFRQIEVNFEALELQKILPYEVWGPDLTGPIVGHTRSEREAAAAARAEAIGAHILVYGVLVNGGQRSELVPEFFVNQSSFEEADEIAGQHELGTVIRVTLPFEDQIQPIENPALAGRVNALSLITLGLAYYSIDDFKNALTYFGQAADEERWVETAGKEIVHLLLGNAYIRQASRYQEPEYLTEASAEYDKALEINRDYGRAKVGQASVLYLLALGDPIQLSINPTLLDDAERLLDETIQLENQPESANLETKVHFYRGMITLSRHFAQLPEGEWLATAQQEFSRVIHNFEADNSRVEELAAHAYARLGIIAREQQDIDQAIVYLQHATEHASPYYEGEYYTWLANLYAETKQWDLVEAAMDEAMAIAEANADPDSIKRYEEKLKRLQSSR